MDKQNPIRVLIVEDHKVTLKGLKLALEEEPDISVVGAAETFTDGLRLCRSFQPAVLLLDLHLPDSPGPRSMIRQFALQLELRIVVFSGEKRQIFREAALAAGAHAYLLKDESDEVIAQTIRNCVTGTHKSDAASGRDCPGVGEPRLSQGEKQILQLLARGMKYQDIADVRVTSPATVRKQCEHLQEKLSLDSREQLIAWAVENGFSGLDE